MTPVAEKAAPRKLLGQVLKEMGLVHEGQIQEALSVQRKKGGVIGKVMRDLGFVTESQVVQALGRQAGLEVVDVKGVDPGEECLARVRRLSPDSRVVDVSDAVGPGYPLHAMPFDVILDALEDEDEGGD